MAFLTQSLTGEVGVARFSKIDQDPFLIEDGIPLCLNPVTEEWMLEQTAALLAKVTCYAVFATQTYPELSRVQFQTAAVKGMSSDGGSDEVVS